MIGFQSRDAKDEEAQKVEWGYADAQEAKDLGAYSAFEKDAIVIFVNDENPYYGQFDQSNDGLNITNGVTHHIYTSGKLNWEEIDRFL